MGKGVSLCMYVLKRYAQTLYKGGFNALGTFYNVVLIIPERIGNREYSNAYIIHNSHSYNLLSGYHFLIYVSVIH